jgi:hypothetical protein
MSFKDPGLGDRLASAASAKNAALAKFRAKPAADDPAVLKRQAERAAECLAVSRLSATMVGASGPSTLRLHWRRQEKCNVQVSSRFGLPSRERFLCVSDEGS